MAPRNARSLPAVAILAVATATLPPPAAGVRGPAPASMIAMIGSSPAAAAVSAVASELDPVNAYRFSLLRLKAHLGVARTLLQLGADGVAFHVGEPMREIVRGIQRELDERGAPLSSDTLDELERVTVAKPQAGLATISLAAAAIDGSFAQTGALDRDSSLVLAERLLRDSVRLYGEAVDDHEVIDLRGYQTGRGYAIQAEALVRHSGALRRQTGHGGLVAAVVLVRQSWPGARPPPIVFDPASVARRLDEALVVMERMR